MIWRKILFTTTILLSFSQLIAGWGDKLDKGQLTHNGITRSWLLHTPDQCTSTQPLPLLVAFHGGGGKARGFARYTDFVRLADQYCFIVVYPQGFKKHWYDSRYSKDVAKIDDAGFVRALIDQLTSTLPVDPQRIYLTGMSNGGVFALELAATHPEWFAGVATVVAQLPENLPELSSNHPLPPLLMINGTKDPVLPYSGGVLKRGGYGRVQSTTDTLAYWRNRSGIKNAAVISRPKDKFKKDGTTVVLHDWQQNGNAVRLIKIVGGGHSWPGKGQYMPRFVVGNASKEFDGSKKIWAFFAKTKSH